MGRRIFGGFMLVGGVIGILLSLGGILYGRRTVDNIGRQIDGSLIIVTDSLDTVLRTLVLAKDTVDQASVALDSVEEAVVDTSHAINQALPLIDQVTIIVSDEVPASLDAVQNTIPDLVQVAGIIDDTLVTLNNFRIDETIPLINFRIQYDLGINYSPEQPFDLSVQQMGDSMEDLPQRLRNMEGYAAVTKDNLQTVAEDMLAISGDLDDVNGEVQKLDPQLEEYVRLVSEVSDNTRRARAAVSGRLTGIKRGLTVAMIWLGLTQLAPLYLGWELVTGQREPAPAPSLSAALAETDA